jgi:Zn-dependent membrane protease YugP
MNTFLKSVKRLALGLTVPVLKLVLFLLGLIIGSSVLVIMALLVGLQVVFQVLALGVGFLTSNFLPKVVTIIVSPLMPKETQSYIPDQKNEWVPPST